VRRPEREVGSVDIPGSPPPAVLRTYRARALGLVRALLLDAAQRSWPGADQARRALAEAVQGFDELRAEVDHPFDRLCRDFALVPAVRLALLLATAPHFDGGVRRLVAGCRSDGGRIIDATLICEVLGLDPEQSDVVGRQLSPGGSMAASGLLYHRRPPPLAHAPTPLELEIAPTTRLVAMFDGRLALDGRCAEWSRLCRCLAEDADGVISDEERARTFPLARAALGRGAVLVSGLANQGKTRLASALAAADGRLFVLETEAALLPREGGELHGALADLAREARIAGGLLVVRDVEHGLGIGGAAAWRAALARMGTGVILTTGLERLPELQGVVSLAICLGSPTTELRRRAWQVELSAQGVALEDTVLGELASLHPLSRSRIAHSVALAQDLAGREARSVSRADLDAAAASQLDSQLARYAQVVTTRAMLADLVLPEELGGEVRELIEAVRARPTVMHTWGMARRLSTGRGIAALFNGPPGTGKTFTAGVIAGELGLPLFRIDVASIVDRYVGETEKNLTRVFEEARASQALLLFDEADSLFGKRTQTKDASDRYANMQVNLLLNLIEDHEGFVILTTNLKSNLDTAFLRRISFKLTFTAPEEAERLVLWQKLLPPEAPLAGDVDLAVLARNHELSGGEIKNAVLRAALTSVSRGQIGQATLQRAAIQEMEAAGKVARPAS
jgi:MoxR-like ATPase